MSQSQAGSADLFNKDDLTAEIPEESVSDLFHPHGSNAQTETEVRAKSKFGRADVKDLFHGQSYGDQLDLSRAQQDLKSAQMEVSQIRNQMMMFNRAMEDRISRLMDYFSDGITSLDKVNIIT
jgi:hypothetical protein